MSPQGWRLPLLPGREMPGSWVHCLWMTPPTVSAGPAGKVLGKLFIFIKPAVHMHSWSRGLQPRLINWGRNTSKSLFSLPPYSSSGFQQNEQCSDIATQIYTVNPPSEHPSCCQRKTNAITEHKIFTGLTSCRWICTEHGSHARPKGVVDLRPAPGLSPLANQPVSPLGWQTLVSCWLCPFKGTDTTNLPPAPLWAFHIPHCSSTHWALLLAVLLPSCPRCFQANTAQENRDIWDCSRAGPAPAWTSGRPGVCDPLSSLSY